MASALHFTLPQERLHPAMNALDHELASRSHTDTTWPGELPLRLVIANSLWAQVGLSFSVPFLDTLARNYGAGVNLVDFRHALELSRLTINDWVASLTDGSIADILPPGSLPGDTCLVLTNALLFEAGWREPFDPEKTQPGPFHLLDGGQVTAQVMHQTHSFPAVQGSDFVAVSLPYQHDQLSLLLVVPDAGHCQDVEAALDASALDGIVSTLTTRPVDLGLPRFTVATATSLESLLSALGMPEAFTDSADFSAMSPTLVPLYIDDVLHGVAIDVSEVGTKAAASTVVIMVPSSDAGVPETLPVIIDRPFLFFLRDEPTSTILFAGRVVDPTKG
jgi:serpin B